MSMNNLTKSIIIPNNNDLTPPPSSATTIQAFDLSIKSLGSVSRKSDKAAMSSSLSITTTISTQNSLSNSKASTPTTDPGGGSSTDADEVKVFGCEKHEEDVDIDGEDSNDRLSPVVKDEDASPTQVSSTNLADRLNSEHQFHSFFPYFISPYYHAAAAGSGTPPFDKIGSLGSLSKFMSPPPAHMSNSNLGIDPNTGVPNPMYPITSSSSFQSLYAQHWRPPMFPFVFPAGYPFSSSVLPQGSPATSSTSAHSSSMTNSSNNPSLQKRTGTSHRSMEQNCQQQSHHKLAVAHDEPKQKKPHIKKPLNAFMLFMKEQRAQVVQECTLRESAAINQILGRKWHELDRNVQQKYYDMARDERMRHMQLYPGWSARDNYGSRKKRGNKGKKREKNPGENGECLNQKKCRARFGLDQQSNWCKHCKRKKKCLRYTEDETNGIGPNSVGAEPWSEDETDLADDSNDELNHCDIPMIDHHESGHVPEHNRNRRSPLHAAISMDSDEENKSRVLHHQQPPNSNASGSSSSTNGTVPISLISSATTSTTTRKDSSSSSSPQTSFLHHRYSMAPPNHFSAAHPYFDPFLQSNPMTLINGLKREI